MQAIDKVVSACERVTGRKGKRAGRELRFPHPCHPDGDDRLSFAVSETADGTVMCHSHKPSYTIAQCLDRLGLTFADLFPESDKRGVKPMKQGGNCTHGYEYTDEMGKPVARVNRIMLDGGKKNFMQGRYEDDTYKPGLNGQALPLYLLTYVQQAKIEGAPIHITEGEEDARSLMRSGVYATTKAGGAGSKWTPEQIECLRDMDAIIWADKDKPGYEAAQTAYGLLLGVAKSVKIVEAITGKDARDHINAGHGPNDYIERDDLIPITPGLGFITFGDDFAYAKPTFVWKPYLPVGKSVLMDANGGTGKSTFALALAAGLSRGILPAGHGSCEPCHTVYMMADNDSPEELETVYRWNHGKVGSLHILQGGDTALNDHNVELLKNDIRRFGAKLLVIDPLMYFLEGLVKDVNDPMAVLPYCRMVGQVAHEMQISILAMRHIPKSAMAKDGVFTGFGSVQFRNSFRGNLFARQHPDDYGLVIITDDKGSLLIPKGEPIAYRRVGDWEKGPVEVQYVSEFDNPFDRSSSGPGRPSTTSDETRAAIEAVLAQGKARASEMLSRLNMRCECSRPTMFRVLKTMGIRADAEGYYSLPNDDPFAEAESTTPPWAGLE